MYFIAATGKRTKPWPQENPSHRVNRNYSKQFLFFTSIVTLEARRHRLLYRFVHKI
jgi:hypothetical protein